MKKRGRPGSVKVKGYTYTRNGKRINVNPNRRRKPKRSQHKTKSS